MSTYTRGVGLRVGTIGVGGGQLLGSAVSESVGVSDQATTVLVTGGSGFTHPGVLLTAPMMTFTAGSIGVAPWSTAYATLVGGLNKNSSVDPVNNVGLFYSNTGWVPHPQAIVYRSSGGGAGSSGDKAEQTDAMAAYVQALVYAYTGNRLAGNNSIYILNSWMRVLTDHPFDTVNYADGKLQAAWCGSLFPRAAEIMRSLWVPSGGDQVLDVPAAINCFKTAFVPRIFDGWTGGGGNWLTSMAEAMIHIGVFCDDRATFNTGLANWRGWVPATVYQTGDVNGYAYTGGGSAALPLAPTGTIYASDTLSGGRAAFISYWYSPTATPPWINGLQSEIGRDPWHAALGLGAAINGAETAWHQGVNLYGEQQTRLVAGLELFAGWIRDVFVSSINPPTTGGAWPFAAAMANNGANNSQRATLEIAYNHYHNRMGVAMPNTLACLTDYSRTGTYNVNLQLAGENITHRDNVARVGLSGTANVPVGAALVAAGTVMLTAETGTNGVALTAANVPATSITTAGSGTATFSNTTAHTGSMSYKFASTTNTDTTFMRIPIQGGTGQLRAEASTWFNVPAWPSGSNHRLQTMRSAAAYTAAVIFRTDGTLAVQDITGATIAATTTVVPAGQWFRVVFDVTVATATTGSGSIAVYLAAGAGSATEVVPFTAANLGTAATTASDIGKSTTTVTASGFTVYVDDAVLTKLVPSGAYTASGSPTVAATFGGARGRPLAFATDYLDYSSTWAALSNASWWCTQWAGTQLHLGIAMLPNDGVSTMAWGAAGAYDSYFTTIATTLVANGQANAVLRIGWEFNGGWYPWSAVGKVADYITYYQRIVTAMRAVPGAAFTFSWSISGGTTSVDLTAAYPGDAFVDYIGLDIYDWHWAVSSDTPATRWAFKLGETYSLNWATAFAALHSKPIGLDEWGVTATASANGGGGGDDPYFVDAMFGWIANNNVAYESYFDTGQSSLSGASNPASFARYVAGMGSAVVNRPITVSAARILKNGSPWAVNGATTNGAPGNAAYALDSQAVSNADLAVNLGLDLLRLTDFINTAGVLGVAEYDPAIWVKVDNQIALVEARGLYVELDLSCFRNLLLAQSTAFNAYTYNWTPFLKFVANRVNTVTHKRYGSDPTIAFVGFAGETGAPDQGGMIARGVTQQNLIDFYATVMTMWGIYAPGQIRIPGGLFFLSDSTMPWRQIYSLTSCDLPAIHSYTSDDEASQPTVNTYTAAMPKPWIVEEFGFGAANYASDALRAVDFTRQHDLARTNGADGVIWWNCDTGSVVPSTAPATCAAIRAYTNITHAGGPYRFFKFQPTALRTPGGNVQLNEWMLLNGAAPVLGAVPSGINFAGAGYEGPQFASDNMASTKWNSSTGVTDGLIYDFGFPTTVTGYRLQTGNDSTGRDPVAWVVYGSTDGTTWTAIDTQTTPTVTTNRSAWTSDFTVTPPAPRPITVSGSQILKNGSPWRINGATTNGAAGGSLSDITQNLDLAVNLGLDLLRLTDFFDIHGTLGTVEYNSATWALVDQTIARAATRGIYVELDLSVYRNLLEQQSTSFNMYTYNWTPFLTFVANRVNTVTGLRYGSDPTIAFVGFAGETGAPDQGGAIARGITQQNLIDFYNNAMTLWGTLAPGQLRIPGGFFFLTDSTMPWRQIYSLASCDLPAIHSYSSDDEGAQPTVNTYCTSINKPWIVEEFGFGAGNYATDALRATDFTRQHDLARTNGADGVIWWNCDTGSIVPSTQPATSAAIRAYTNLAHSGAYRYFKFQPTALRTPGNALVQLTEWTLLNGATIVPSGSVTGVAFTGASYEGPTCAGDLVSTTKWCSSTGVTDGLIYDLGFPTPVTGYRLQTGSDAIERDPVAWVVYGSTDGSTWYPVDTQTTPTVTTTRLAWTGDFTIGVTLNKGLSIPGTQLAFESQTDLDHDMAMVAATGAKRVRFDVAAVQIEVTAGVRDWSNIDRIVASAVAHGLQPMGILTTLPVWSATSWQVGPSTSGQRTAFTNFAAAAVARYASTVTYWEVWNEPNNPSFWATPSSSDYALLLKAAYPVIKTANASAKVLMGGPAGGQSSPNDTVSWFTSLYGNGCKAYFDIANIHAYPDSYGAGPTSGEMSHIAAIRTIMSTNTDSAKLLWATECGFPTGGANSVDEATQALFLAALWSNWTTATGNQRGPLFFYTIRDTQTPADREGYFGIAHYDFSVKPAIAAVTSVD